MIVLNFQEWLVTEEEMFKEGFWSDQAWPSIRKKLKWIFGPAAPYVSAILELSIHALSKGSLEAAWQDLKDPGEKAHIVFKKITSRLKKLVGRNSEEIQEEMPSLVELIKSIFMLIRAAIFSFLYFGPVPAPLLMLCFGGDQRTFDEIILTKQEIEGTNITGNTKMIFDLFWKLIEILQKMCAISIIPTKLAQEKNPMDWENIKNLAKDIKQKDEI